MIKRTGRVVAWVLWLSPVAVIVVFWAIGISRAGWR
jgi:hypothetical protein